MKYKGAERELIKKHDAEIEEHIEKYHNLEHEHEKKIQEHIETCHNLEHEHTNHCHEMTKSNQK